MAVNQFTVIITDDITDTHIKVKKGRADTIKQKAKTYMTTETGHKILLKPPKLSQLKGYDADLVVNETCKTSLTEVPAAPDAVIVETQ